MGSVCGSLVKLCGFCCTQLAQRLPFQIEPVSAVDQSIKHGICDGGITEHLEMPQRLTGESLGSGSLIRIIPCMASAIRSVIDTQGEDRR
jgi:hypothetical protein